MPFPVITLQNLMQYDDTLFDGIVLPQNANLDYMKYAILFNYGEMQVVYPDWSVFRFCAENWFASHLSQLQHLFNDWEASYNPVYNKDGYFEETRTPDLYHSKTTGEYSETTSSGTRNTDSKSNSNSTQTPNLTTTETPGKIITESGSTEEQYKGFNSSSYNGVTKELPGKVSTESGSTTVANTGTDNINASGSGTVKETEQGNGSITKSGNETESETGTENIYRHEYGNIGVTMASQMLRDDKAFWETFAFYDVAAKLFAVDNLIMVY